MCLASLVPACTKHAPSSRSIRQAMHIAAPAVSAWWHERMEIAAGLLAPGLQDSPQHRHGSA